MNENGGPVDTTKCRMFGNEFPQRNSAQKSSCTVLGTKAKSIFSCKKFSSACTSIKALNSDDSVFTKA